MTWIVGGPGLVAPFMAGDICVTFTHANGRRETHDCLQKIYPLGRNVLAGFAGSVDIGLRMLTAMSNATPNDGYVDLPRVAVEWFPRFARRFFREAPAGLRAHGCEILMVGVHPYLQRAIIPAPNTNAVRFIAPRFEPEMTNDTFAVLGIGSGQVLEELRSAALNAVRSSGFHRTDEFMFAGGTVNKEGDLQIQRTGGFAGPAAKMAFALRHALGKYPAPGVSRWFVYGSVSLNAPAVIEAPVYAFLPQSGEQARLAPPPFVAGLAGFQQFLQAHGLAASAAVG